MHARDIGCCIEEILSMLRWRNPDIRRCSGDCQGGKYGETSIGRQQLGGSSALLRVCAAYGVRHSRDSSAIPHMPGIPFSHPQLRFTLPYETRSPKLHYYCYRIQTKASLLDLVQVHTYSYVKSRSGRHKELLSELGKKQKCQIWRFYVLSLRAFTNHNCK